MGSFPETYIDLIKLVMLYCHAIYIYIYIFGGGGGPKGLGEGWVVVVKMPQLKIMTIVSFQKAN